MPIASSAAFRLSILLIASLAFGAAVAQESFSSLEERMTGKEFRDAGLHKLSDDELAALNRWIRQRSLAENEIEELARERAERADGGSSGAASDRRGFSDGGDEQPIESRLVGTFDGWSGDTEFELENGMVWRQLEPDRFEVSEVENPSVTITPGLFGSWRIKVGDYNRTITVERIE